MSLLPPEAYEAYRIFQPQMSEMLDAARVMVDEANSFGWSGRGGKGYTISWQDGRSAHAAFATLRRVVEANRGTIGAQSNPDPSTEEKS